MSPNADVSLIQSFLDHVAKRLGAIAASEGAAGGLALATVLLLLRWSSPFNMAVTAVVVLLSIVAGVAVRLFMLAQERQQVAREVERAAPGCHNLVVAAEELANVLSHDLIPLEFGANIRRPASQVCNS